MMQPLMKWSGSKRHQAKAITSFIQKDYKTYYEPFCGSCAVLVEILCSMPDRFSHFVASDLNKHLIDSYNLVKANPGKVADGYRQRWEELNSSGNSIEDKKAYFASVRDRFNRSHDPLDFIFIMRTTTNGMPRYNANGEFNNSFHVTRNGIEPDTFQKIVNDWSELLNRHNVQFINRTYADLCPCNDDFLYLDPPYANTKGMYFGNFDNKALFEWLGDVGCDYMMSYDGIAGEEDLTFGVPNDLYRRHVYLDSGNSSFRRVIGKDRHCDVKESLYLSFE